MSDLKKYTVTYSYTLMGSFEVEAYDEYDAREEAESLAPTPEPEGVDYVTGSFTVEDVSEVCEVITSSI
jgi:hypothetical protein